MWPYIAGGLLLEVNFTRKCSPVAFRGGLIIEGGLWSWGLIAQGALYKAEVKLIITLLVQTFTVLCSDNNFSL